jgi:hypothetical protein
MNSFDSRVSARMVVRVVQDRALPGLRGQRDGAHARLAALWPKNLATATKCGIDADQLGSGLQVADDSRAAGWFSRAHGAWLVEGGRQPLHFRSSE